MAEYVNNIRAPDNSTICVSFVVKWKVECKTKNLLTIRNIFGCFHLNFCVFLEKMARFFINRHTHQDSPTRIMLLETTIERIDQQV